MNISSFSSLSSTPPLTLFFILFYFFDHAAWYAGSGPGIDSEPPAVEAQSRNHRTAREVPGMSYFVKGVRSVSRSFFFFGMWMLSCFSTIC